MISCHIIKSMNQGLSIDAQLDALFDSFPGNILYHKPSFGHWQHVNKLAGNRKLFCKHQQCLCTKKTKMLCTDLKFSNRPFQDIQSTF